MSTVKYTRLPMTDNEGSVAFDFSSAFSYEDGSATGMKYRSAFTYGNAVAHKHDEPAPTSTDKAIRILVTCGFLVVFVLTFPIMVWFSFKKLQVNERYVIFRLGRLYSSKGPGWVFVFPVLDRCHKVDVRLKAFSVPPKQLITEDGGIIEVGAEIYFQIIDAEKSVTNVQNLDQSTRILLQTLLCNILSQKSLSEIEAERRAIAEKLQVSSNEVCAGWGVEISRVELSQIKVLTEPPVKKKPTFMMPPGLFGAGAAGGEGEELPAVLAQLAGALTSAKDADTTEAIAMALKAFSQPAQPVGMPPVENPNNPMMQLLQQPQQQQQPTLIVPDSSQAAAAASAAQAYGSTLFLETPKLTPEEILKSIREALSEELVEKVKATFGFEIIGPEGGLYHLNLKDGAGSITEGPSPMGEPDATLTLTFDDLQAMLAGRLMPYQAYMSGRLRVAGDMSTALKLDTLAKKMQHDRNKNNSNAEGGIVHL